MTDEITALRAENERLAAELATAKECIANLEESEERLERELETANAERLAADNDLVDRYRNPKSGVFKFPDDVAKVIRRLDDAEAELARSEAAAREKVAGAYLAAADACVDNTWRHEGEDAYSRGLDRGALEQASACAAHIRALTPADATAALEARYARVRAEVIEEARKILQEAVWENPMEVVERVRNKALISCDVKIDALHTTASRAISEGGE